MPKINVYLPDDLANEVRARNIPVSRVAQEALREEVERMRAIELNTPESKQLLGDIRYALASAMESTASFRERVAEEYPEDIRNAQCAGELRDLAAELRTNDALDDTPALRKLLRVVVTYQPPLDGLVPSDPSHFNASQFRFRDNESYDSFLGRLADALEEEMHELTVGTED